MSGQPAADARVRAEARFKLLQERAADARKVVEEINAANAAERAKTARLKALRLAKQEADEAAAKAQPVAPKKTRAASRSTRV